MRVFITGATGFLGPAIANDLIKRGYQVVGLARSQASAEMLQANGVQPLIGSLTNLSVLRQGAEAADGVIHLAYSFSPGDMPRTRMLSAVFGGWPGSIMGRMMKAITATNDAALNALASALGGSERPLVTAFATMGIAGASGASARGIAIETDCPNAASPGYVRSVSEALVEHWASRKVRASIVRLAPAVHGTGDKGLIPQLALAARKHGEVIYVGEGANHWSGVHINDAVSLFRLALEKGKFGGVYHGVGNDVLTYREIAEVMGQRLGLPLRSGTQADAARQFGFTAPFVSVDNPVSSALTQAELGWAPAGLSLIDDLKSPAYFSS